MEVVSGGQTAPPALGLLVALPARQVNREKLPYWPLARTVGPRSGRLFTLPGALCPGLSPLSLGSRRRRGGAWQGHRLPPPLARSTAVCDTPGPQILEESSPRRQTWPLAPPHSLLPRMDALLTPTLALLFPDAAHGSSARSVPSQL